MNVDLKASFLETAIAVRNKMRAICDIDPVGDFEVCSGSCRTNRDRLVSLDRWIERLGETT